MSRAIRFAPLVLLVLLLAGLVWRLATPADTTVSSKLEGKPVPAFTLPAALPSKPALASANLATGKPRIVNVFASWCVPCITEVHVLQDLKSQGVTIDGIAVRDTPGALTAFLARNGDPYERIGGDSQSQVQIAFGSSGVPETFVIDGKGVIRRQYFGALNASNMPGVLRELEQAR